MDQAGQGQVAPAAGEGLEAAGGAGFIDLQTSLPHGPHLTEHRFRTDLPAGYLEAVFVELRSVGTDLSLGLASG
jgi:hypothetical protein